MRKTGKGALRLRGLLPKLQKLLAILPGVVIMGKCIKCGRLTVLNKNYCWRCKARMGPQPVLTGGPPVGWGGIKKMLGIETGQKLGERLANWYLKKRGRS
jgi:hypothetical protein